MPLGIRLFLIGAAVACAAILAGRLGAQRTSSQPTGAAVPDVITIYYPLEGSVFPPEITAPTFLWRDPDPRAAAWTIDIEFHDGGP